MSWVTTPPGSEIMVGVPFDYVVKLTNVGGDSDPTIVTFTIPADGPQIVGGSFPGGGDCTVSPDPPVPSQSSTATCNLGILPPGDTEITFVLLPDQTGPTPPGTINIVTTNPETKDQVGQAAGPPGGSAKQAANQPGRTTWFPTRGP